MNPAVAFHASFAGMNNRPRCFGSTRWKSCLNIYRVDADDCIVHLEKELDVVIGLEFND